MNDSYAYLNRPSSDSWASSSDQIRDEKIEITVETPGKKGHIWSWLGFLILWFIVFTVILWLIYYSLKPPFVIQKDGTQVDTAKVLLAALISALILIIIVGIINLFYTRYQKR